MIEKGLPTTLPQPPNVLPITRRLQRSRSRSAESVVQKRHDLAREAVGCMGGLGVLAHDVGLLPA